MKKYYVNQQDHEVQDESCRYLQGVKNRFCLDEFSSCTGAVARAKNHFDQVNSCKFCSPVCHTSEDQGQVVNLSAITVQN